MFLLGREEAERYVRQMLLPEVAGGGQERLARGKALVVGLGGLGSPAALYLAAAGVGTLGLLDPDRVEISNLNRQILYDTESIGRGKAEVAAEKLKRLNPGVRVSAREERLGVENASALIEPYDIILDGLDNLADRYVLNEAALRAGKTLVTAGVGAWDGFVLLVDGDGPCLRCLFPDPPEAVGCGDLGVLGAFTGVIGSFQALLALRSLLGLPAPGGRLWVFDGRSARFRQTFWPKDPACPVCGQQGEKGLSCLADRTETL